VRWSVIPISPRNSPTSRASARNSRLNWLSRCAHQTHCAHLIRATTETLRVKSPLAGLRIMLTRPARSNDDIADALRHAGAIVDEVPLVRIVPPADAAALESAAAAADMADWVAFTSANGVAAFARARREPLGEHMRVAAVGSSTAAAVKSLLFRQVDAVPPTFVAEALADAIAAMGPPNASIVVFQAQGAREALVQKLRDHGFTVTAVAAYATVEAPPADLAEHVRAADAIVLTSASGARSLMQGIRAADLAARAVVCIGDITAQAARGLGIPVAATAHAASAKGVVEALDTVFSH
jgi:uroporphyrinogen-III synthase